MVPLDVRAARDGENEQRSAGTGDLDDYLPLDRPGSCCCWLAVWLALWLCLLALLAGAACCERRAKDVFLFLLPPAKGLSRGKGLATQLVNSLIMEWRRKDEQATKAAGDDESDDSKDR